MKQFWAQLSSSLCLSVTGW